MPARLIKKLQKLYATVEKKQKKLLIDNLFL